MAADPAGIWTNPKALAISLLVAFVDAFGTEALEWHPDTIVAELKSEFGVDVSEAVLDRLLIAVMIVTTDLFRRHLPSFIHAATTLSGAVWDPSVPDPAEADECAWAIAEATLLDPPADEDARGQKAFSKAIVSYVAQTCRYEGLVRPPDILKIGPGIGDRTVMETRESAVVASGIRDMLRERLGLLVGQLEALPLGNGSGKEAAQNLRKLLETRAES